VGGAARARSGTPRSAATCSRPPRQPRLTSPRSRRRTHRAIRHPMNAIPSRSAPKRADGPTSAARVACRSRSCGGLSAEDGSRLGQPGSRSWGTGSMGGRRLVATAGRRRPAAATARARAPRIQRSHPSIGPRSHGTPPYTTTR
jgi:hypothetical protein